MILIKYIKSEWDAESFFARGTSLLLFIGLVLINYSVLSDHVLWSIRRQVLLPSFYLGGVSECEDVLLELALLDKIFKALMERPALKSLMSLAIMEGAIFFHSGTNRVVLLRHLLLHVGEHLEELAFIYWWWVDVFSCPLWSCGDSLFHYEAEVKAARGMMPLVVAMNLPLEVVPSPGARLPFRAMTRRRGFLRMGLVEERFKCRDSDLNESISLWWRLYTDPCYKWG